MAAPFQGYFDLRQQWMNNWGDSSSPPALDPFWQKYATPYLDKSYGGDDPKQKWSLEFHNLPTVAFNQNWLNHPLFKGKPEYAQELGNIGSWAPADLGAGGYLLDPNLIMDDPNYGKITPQSNVGWKKTAVDNIGNTALKLGYGLVGGGIGSAFLGPLLGGVMGKTLGGALAKGLGSQIFPMAMGHKFNPVSLASAFLPALFNNSFMGAAFRGIPTEALNMLKFANMLRSYNNSRTRGR